MNLWVILYRLAWGLLVLLVIFGVVCVFLPRSHALRHYQKRRVRLEEENQIMENRIRELSESQARFRADPAFVELTAREAGMVKSNEFIYKLAEGVERP